MNITSDYLKQRITYDKSTGVFYWLPVEETTQYNKTWNKRYAGKRAGTAGRYWQIVIDKVSYLAHRLAYLYVIGQFPTGEIDHINLNKLDNRWDNLRECLHEQNCMNRSAHKNNTSGHKGVSLRKTTGNWEVQIVANGNHRRFGEYKRKEDAVKAYNEAAESLHGDFKRLTLNTEKD